MLRQLLWGHERDDMDDSVAARDDVDAEYVAELGSRARSAARRRDQEISAPADFDAAALDAVGAQIKGVVLQLAQFKWASLVDGEQPVSIVGPKLEVGVQRGYATPITDRSMAIIQVAARLATHHSTYSSLTFCHPPLVTSCPPPTAITLRLHRP